MVECPEKRSGERLLDGTLFCLTSNVANVGAPLFLCVGVVQERIGAQHIVVPLLYPGLK